MIGEQIHRLETSKPLDLDLEIDHLFQIASSESNLVVFSGGSVLGYHFGMNGKFYSEKVGDYQGVLRSILARIHTRFSCAPHSLNGSVYGFQGEVVFRDESFLMVVYNNSTFPQLWLRRMDRPRSTQA